MSKSAEYEPLSVHYLSNRLCAGKMIQRLVDEGRLTSHTAGYTYLCSAPDGLLKIGFTTKDVNDRIKKLGRGFELLYYLKGGESLEILAQYKFHEYRLPVYGERFVDHEEIRDWFANHPLRVDPYILRYVITVNPGQDPEQVKKLVEMAVRPFGTVTWE